jgi:ATPase subunit of ABC transporter with duplicated ATPase domains
MGLKEKLALGAGKLAGGVKNVATGTYHAAGDAAHNAKEGYNSYQRDRQWNKMVKEEENRVRREKAEDMALAREHSRWTGSSGEHGRTTTNQKMREEIASARLKDEQVKARELKADRKRMRNAETQASLNKRQAKLQGRAPSSGSSSIGNTGGVMDVLEGRAGPGQGLDDVNRRLRGFF